MSFIKFAVKSVRTDQNGRLIRATIGNMMESGKNTLSINEIPLVMATLMNSQVKESSDQNNQFTYTFPFKLN